MSWQTFLKVALLALFFSYYILMTRLIMISVTLLSMLMAVPYVGSGIWFMRTTWISFFSWIWTTKYWDRNWFIHFNARKTQLLWLNNSGTNNTKIDRYFLEGISSLKMLGLYFFSKLPNYNVFIVKTSLFYEVSFFLNSSLFL